MNIPNFNIKLTSAFSAIFICTALLVQLLVYIFNHEPFQDLFGMAAFVVLILFAFVMFETIQWSQRLLSLHYNFIIIPDSVIQKNQMIIVTNMWYGGIITTIWFLLGQPT